MNAGKTLPSDAAYFRQSSFRALAGSDQPPSNSLTASHLGIDKEFVFRTDGSGAIANPAPLGLFSFAFTTLFLSFKNVSIAEDSFINIVFAFAAALGGFVQILAGQWEFTKKNTFGAVAFSAYGAFWVGLAIFHYAGLAWPSASVKAQKGMAIFYALWGFFSFNLWLLTFKISVALNVTFLALVSFLGLLGGSE
jgi:succinate-acetate transporter protein